MICGRGGWWTPSIPSHPCWASRCLVRYGLGTDLISLGTCFVECGLATRLVRFGLGTHDVLGRPNCDDDQVHRT